MPTVAIIAALPRELAQLARVLQATRTLRADGILVQTAKLPQGQNILLVTAGMGLQRAGMAVAAALVHGPLDALLSVGLSGACDPGVRPGTVLQASIVIDSRSGERFTPEAFPGMAVPGILVTSAEVAGIEEKRRLYQSYGAAAVDMEAATVARLAHAHGIRFAAFKAISDEHDVDVTYLSAFADARGQFRTPFFAAHTVLRPHRWRHTARLGRTSKTAISQLTAVLKDLLT